MKKLNAIWLKILDLADEASTWRGIVWFISGVIDIFWPEKTLMSIAIASLLSGSIGALFKDSKNKQLQKIGQAIEEGIPVNKNKNIT